MTVTHDFDEIRAEFDRRVQRIAWCTVATVDTKGRPRSRILHPNWEGTTGWILTMRNSLKAKHLATTPWISCSYWDPSHEQVHAECRAEWEDAPETRRRVWDVFKANPEPYGYDPGTIWTHGPDDPAFGVLKLTPWRIELWSLNAMATGHDRMVWKPG